MKEKRNTILWCHKDGDRYEDFYDHPDVVKFCGHTEEAGRGWKLPVEIIEL